MSDSANSINSQKVPINEDVLVRLVTFLKVIVAAVLKVYPFFVAVAFIIFFALLGFLALFSSLFFPSTIP